MKPEESVKEYQCPGCAGGVYPECFQKSPMGVGCVKHCPGTMSPGIGTFFLGLPKGFCRLGASKPESMPILIFENEKQFLEE